MELLLKCEQHKHEENLKACGDSEISRKFEMVRHQMKEYLIRDKHGEKSNEKDRGLNI